MKTFKYIGIAVMAAIMSFGLPSPSKVNAQPGVAVSFNIFYNSLSPYGHWINHAHYGSVWIPSVPRDFHPYMTNGRWVMTEFGNTWVSDYAWGWAPFHYGRWFYDDFYGWAWVPDYVWGPGWVNWRNGGGYYGWAPLMPGLDIHIAVNIPIHFWIFVPHRHFMHDRWHRYVLPRTRVTKIYNNTTIINNYYVYNNHQYVYGPRYAEIEKNTRRSVPVYNYSARGNSGEFREVVSRANPESARKTIVARESNLNSRTPVATPGSNRNSADDVYSAPRSSRTSTTESRGSAAPARRVEPATVNTAPRSETSPATNARTAPEVRTRETPARSSAPAVNDREPAARTTPESRGNSRTSTAPTAERTAPAARSSSRESVSPARSSRESAAPARSSSPSRSESSGRSSGRGNTSERGGR